MKAQTALRQVPREHLEKMALNMRRKARNQAMDSARMKARLMTAVVGAGSAYGVGFLMGMRQSQGQPTDWGGVDMELVLGGVGALGGIFLQGKSGSRTLGEYLESGGMGVLSYYAGSRGEQHGATSQAA